MPTKFLLLKSVPLRWGSLRCKSKFWARNFKFWARDVHPTISQAQVPLRRGSLRYGANRHSGREISNSGPEMCTPLFLRPKSKPAGREKPIRVAPIRVAAKYPILGGGGVVGFLERGGWKCQFYFYGRGDFSDRPIFT